ncbi:hypothetical protein MNBD_ALPHA12-537 [hydrothermal vent metagenome]|uniref:Nitrous oxide reductase maturation protein, outer-membrane lipoprotein NosL n=1 Tax=hydrothermal vent metagenome TaxID=652676 RepID=A0A3B0UE02_9ZZZZ
MKISSIVAVAISLLFLAACSAPVEQAGIPKAATLGDEATGYYCQMILIDHDGPKAQIFLKGQDKPLWFAQVRDAIAYLRAPEQSGEIVAFYVNDMGKADSWAEPGIDNWIKAKNAFYVMGSDAEGGMGAPEMVPFADKQQAEKFALERGGKVVALDDIKQEMVLSPVEFDGAKMQMEMGDKPQ